MPRAGTTCEACGQHAAVFPDFIEVYDDALDPAVCHALVDRFDRSHAARRGATGSGMNLRLKDSSDISISNDTAWADAEQTSNRAALGGLRRYVRTYPHTVLAPLQLQTVDPTTGAPRQLEPDDITTMHDDALDGLLTTIFRPGPVNLQKYLAWWHRPHSRTPTAATCPEGNKLIATSWILFQRAEVLYARTA